MSGLVRIVIDRNETRFYLGGFVDDPNDKGKHLPELLNADRVRQSWLGSRDRAVQLVKVLREQSWDAHILDPSTGSLLYEDAVQRFTPTTPTVEQSREPYQCNGVLIVPASLGRWAIRFPGQSIESLYGSTPGEVYQKLADHPGFSELYKLAEKYIAPAKPVIDPQEVARQEQFARHGRLRPGSL
jgi:hypothetical protein